MVRYSIEIGQQEQDILKEIVLASDKNVKKRKFATGLSSVMAVIMLIYTILCFMNSRIGYGIIGLLFSVFFIWIIINGANTFQKKVINIVHSKMDNKLTSGKREYCFDTDGITVSSDSQERQCFKQLCKRLDVYLMCGVAATPATKESRLVWIVLPLLTTFCITI